MARDDGLITPTTCPLRLASDRTFTHVRATTGVHAILSTALATPEGAVVIRRATLSAASTPLTELTVVLPVALSVTFSPALIASRVTPVAGSLLAVVPGEAEATLRNGGAYCQTPMLAVSTTATAAALRMSTGDTAGNDTDLFTSPHQWQVESTRCMMPHERHFLSFARSPRASSVLNGCVHFGHCEAATKAFDPHCVQRI
jgi:hypothetical protein